MCASTRGSVHLGRSQTSPCAPCWRPQVRTLTLWPDGPSRSCADYAKVKHWACNGDALTGIRARCGSIVSCDGSELDTAAATRRLNRISAESRDPASARRERTTTAPATAAGLAIRVPASQRLPSPHRHLGTGPGAAQDGPVRTDYPDRHRSKALLPAQVNDLADNRRRGPPGLAMRARGPVVHPLGTYHLVPLGPPFRGRPGHVIPFRSAGDPPPLINDEASQAQSRTRSQSGIGVGHEDLLVVKRFLDSSTPRREVFPIKNIQIVSSHDLDQRAWSVHLDQLGLGQASLNRPAHGPVAHVWHSAWNRRDTALR
jgi:hypothetical protein